MARKILTQEKLKQLLDYNPETGEFTWKKRPLSDFKTKQGQKIFNTRFSGKPAGSINASGYHQIFISDNQNSLKITYQAHRLAWLYVHGKLPSNHMDHINHDRADNRICNLREVTPLENNVNQGISKNNTSGVSGVHWCKSSKTWQAKIRFNNKTIYLGCFKNKEGAVDVRQQAEKKYGFHNNHGKTMEEVDEVNVE